MTKPHTNLNGPEKYNKNRQKKHKIFIFKLATYCSTTSNFSMQKTVQKIVKNVRGFFDKELDTEKFHWGGILLFSNKEIMYKTLYLKLRLKRF
jgi:hypothetical protein